MGYRVGMLMVGKKAGWKLAVAAFALFALCGLAEGFPEFGKIDVLINNAGPGRPGPPKAWPNRVGEALTSPTCTLFAITSQL
jgi:NAD(P)-dependent dehydrogenase (short-subunit alcohol dehydrogenase family)